MHKLSLCIIHCLFSTAKTVTRMRLNVMLDVHFLSCVCFFFFDFVSEKPYETYKCTMWVEFNMWNLVVHDATTGPQRVNFHQATVRNMRLRSIT